MNSNSWVVQRSKLLRALRYFFYQQDFLEVQTPVKIAAPLPEEYIEAVSSENEFLRTSPEAEMKRLLADGVEKIFQIGSCFRYGEFGRKHREEFTMLEYYAKDWNYIKLSNYTSKMLQYACKELLGSETFSYQGNSVDFNYVEYISVDEAYKKYANIDCFSADKDGSFDEIMVTKIEPNLGTKGITFLYNYPATRASLSRLCSDNELFAERWEMYCCGIELANAFGELTDEKEQKQRFETAMQFRKTQGMKNYPEPINFYDTLKRGIPESSGCALGFDRLLMLLMDADNIDKVMF